VQVVLGLHKVCTHLNQLKCMSSGAHPEYRNLLPRKGEHGNLVLYTGVNHLGRSQTTPTPSMHSVLTPTLITHVHPQEMQDHDHIVSEDS
jgi:hypothetical protein